MQLPHRHIDGLADTFGAFTLQAWCSLLMQPHFSQTAVVLTIAKSCSDASATALLHFMKYEYSCCLDPKADALDVMFDEGRLPAHYAGPWHMQSLHHLLC